MQQGGENSIILLVIDTIGGGTGAKYPVYPTAANTPAG